MVVMGTVMVKTALMGLMEFTRNGENGVIVSKLLWSTRHDWLNRNWT
jgi:hypothetical protein